MSYIDDLISKLKTFNPNNPDSQWKACDLLGNINDPENNQKIVDSLIDAANDTNCAATRAYAIVALGKHGGKKAIEKLKYSLISDQYPLARSYAIKALRMLNEESAIPILIHLLQDENQFYGVHFESIDAIKDICAKSTSDICKMAIQLLDKKRDETTILLNTTTDKEKRKLLERMSGSLRRVNE
jgi:HEAT repeat protein